MKRAREEMMANFILIVLVWFELFWFGCRLLVFDFVRANRTFLRLEGHQRSIFGYSLQLTQIATSHPSDPKVQEYIRINSADLTIYQ